MQELTLRSTQLASSTFDFFSIFFASGLIYLVLTGAVSVIQLFVEWRSISTAPRRKRRLAVFLPWRRVDLAPKPALAEQARRSTIAQRNAADDIVAAVRRRRSRRGSRQARRDGRRATMSRSR